MYEMFGMVSREVFENTQVFSEGNLQITVLTAPALDLILLFITNIHMNLLIYIFCLVFVLVG